MTKTNIAPMHSDKPTLLDMNANTKKVVTQAILPTIRKNKDKYFISKPFIISEYKSMYKTMRKYNTIDTKNI